MRTLSLGPWRKASQVVHAHFYWMPVSGFPCKGAQREWITRFTLALAAQAKDLLQLEPEFLLNSEVLEGKLLDTFTANSRQHCPTIGVSRNPAEALKPAPTMESFEPLRRGEKEFRMADFAPAYTYWMAGRKLDAALADFCGHGGAAVVFHPPDPNSAPPPMPPIMAFRNDPHLGPAQIQSSVNMLFAFKSAFLKESKRVFGRGIENHPQFETLQFVIPRWNAQFYLSSPPDAIAEGFQVFPIQLVESPADGGLILASAVNLDELIAGLIHSPFPE
jgi:hypothetical protein